MENNKNTRDNKNQEQGKEYTLGHCVFKENLSKKSYY